MDPFSAVLVVTLHPLACHFLHAYETVLIIFEIFMAFEAKNIFILNNILLIFESIWTYFAFKTWLTGIFNRIQRLFLIYSFQLPTKLMKQIETYNTFKISRPYWHMALTTRRTLLALPHPILLIRSIDINNPFFIFHLLLFQIWCTLSVTKWEAIFASVTWEVVDDVVAV